ncbi:MAG: radical SAM protein [Nanobdellota archaeon]
MKTNKFSPSPLHVIWHITNKCNMACSYCFSGSTFKNRKFKIDGDQIVHRINTSPKVKRITIIGGEPFLISNLKKIIKSLNKNILIQIDSNFTIEADSLVNYENVTFSTTLDGHNKELHEKTRGNFEKIIDNIKFCILKKKEVKVNIVVNRFNYNYLYKIASFVRNLGVTRFSFNKCKEFHTQTKLSPTADDEKIVEDIQKIIKDFKDCKIDMNGFYTHNYFKNHAQLPSCFCGVYKITIGPKGNLYPCELIPFFKTRYLSLPPNVKEYSLDEAMQTDLFSEFRNATTKHLPLGCTNCEYNMKCSHGCRFIAYLNSGSLHGKNLSCSLVSTDIYDVFGICLFLPHSSYTKKRISSFKPFFKKHEYIFMDKRILDIGCAGGQFTFYVESITKSAIGIDTKKDFIDYANIIKKEKCSKANFFSTDFERIDFKGIDTVMLIGNALPHFQVKKFISLIKKLKHVNYFLIEFKDSTINENFEGKYKLGNQLIKERTYRKNHYLIRELQNKSNNLSAKIRQYAWSAEKVKKFLPFQLIEEKKENNNVILLYRISD